ncbi:MAG: SDR family oxidoreductase [Mucilaginibacter sp.]
MQSAKKVSILGCGWYGFSLAVALLNKKIAVKGSTTSSEKLQKLAVAGIEPHLVSFESDNETYAPEFFDCDALFVCFPPKVRNGSATNYLNKIERIIEALKTTTVKQVIFISSTGVYGDNNKEVNETDEPLPDSESGRALLKAEELLQQQTSFTTTIIRFGGLIGPGRDPGRFLAGKKDVPNGLVPVNLIHLTDCIGVSEAIIDQSAFGYVYNACAPNHPAKADFYTKATLRSGLEVPEFINEKKTWKIVSSVNTDRILKYQYKVADLMGWLDETAS